MNIVANALAQAIADINTFSALVLKRPLRPYQAEALAPIVESVIRRDGNQYVIRWPRQSGKNESLAILDAYLLFLYQRVKGASLVHTAPTFDPQCKNAIQRLADITAGNPFFKGLKFSGNVVTLGKCRSIYLSGMEREKPNVGSTASLLLKKDECQDLNQDYIERAFDPMTANTHAPHVHTGTARHTGTYLARKRLALEELERQDGKRRVFTINWRDVAAVNPAYGAQVQQIIAQHGPLHPMVQTEYENVETAQTGRLFDDRRVALIFTRDLPRRRAPRPGEIYAATIDVGGTTLQGDAITTHDFTVVTIFLVTFDGGLNVFEAIDYYTIEGANVLDDTPARRKLFACLDLWHPARIVPDSTGLGIGLSSALISRYATRVIPFIFTASTKTDLLNTWLALIETGRYHHYATGPNGLIDIDLERYRAQLEKCEHEERLNHTLWGIPSHVTWFNPCTQRDDLLHDDHLLSNALVAVLANADLAPRSATSRPAPARPASSMED